MTNPNGQPSTPNKPPLSQAAVDLLGNIITAKYPSQLRGYGPKIARSVLDKELKSEEVDTVFGAIKQRREHLMAQTDAEPPLDPPEFITPTPAQPAVQEPRELDWRERQLPVGDRD